MRRFLLAISTCVLVPASAYANGGDFFGSAVGGALGGMLGTMMTRPAPQPTYVVPPPTVYYTPPPTVVVPRVVVAPRPSSLTLRVQRRLQELGFLPVTDEIDGVEGPETRAAIRAWQRTSGYPVTGYLSDAALGALLSAPTGPPAVPPAATAAQPPAVTTAAQTAPAAPAAAPAVTPISLPSTNQPILGEWNGTGLTVTPPFHTNGPWEVEWASSEGFSADVGQIGKDGFNPVGQQSSGGQGTSYVPAPSGGDFILKLNGAGHWLVRVISLAPATPQPAAPPTTTQAVATQPAVAAPTVTQTASKIDPGALTCGGFAQMDTDSQTQTLRIELLALQQPVTTLQRAVKTSANLDDKAAITTTTGYIVDGVAKECISDSHLRLVDALHNAIDNAMMSLIQHNAPQGTNASKL